MRPAAPKRPTGLRELLSRAASATTAAAEAVRAAVQTASGSFPLGGGFGGLAPGAWQQPAEVGLARHHFPMGHAGGGEAEGRLASAPPLLRASGGPLAADAATADGR